MATEPGLRLAETVRRFRWMAVLQESAAARVRVLPSDFGQAVFAASIHL